VGVISYEAFYQQEVHVLISKWQDVLHLETRKAACRVIIDFNLQGEQWQLIPLDILI
jgi:hypothetical protein